MNKILWGSFVSLAFSCSLVSCEDSASGNGPQDPDTSSSSAVSSSSITAVSSSSVVVPFGSSSSAGVLGSSSSTGSSSAGTALSSSSVAVPSSSSAAVQGSSSSTGCSSAGTASSSSSAAVPSSSSNAALGGNTQICVYSPIGNTLACTEKTYRTVTIGTQTWMAENLNVGTMVPGTANQSDTAAIEKYCYNDHVTVCATDGGFYQWAEAMALPSTCNSIECAAQISSGHHQGICPMGWHIPKPAEWDALATYLGGEDVAGKTMKLNNTGHTTWDASTYNDGNASGFSALPAGYRYDSYGGGFDLRGSKVNFWEASEGGVFDAYYAYSRNLLSGHAELGAYNFQKAYGFSVRCLRDER